ncbi:MAG: hypothetical protein LBD97_05735 [Bifidobacteriaceae bacterium]|jgi:hypothetical protein|nr:hypothetical protein [Bifidobacteriaceae bacterium]
MGNQRSTIVVALVALLALALGIGCYFLVYVPVLDERSAALAAAEEAENANLAAEQELAELAKESEQLEQMKVELEAARDQFPTSLELADFTEYLWQLAEESKADVLSVHRQSPVKLTVAQPLPEGPGGQAAPTVPQPPDRFYQYLFTIKIKGVFTQTQAFLDLLQRDGARMFLVTGVQMTPGSSEIQPDATTVAEYTIQGYTYALVPENQIPATSAEGGGGN